MVFKIFKQKKKILSEPTLPVQPYSPHQHLYKPIIYYSVDKKEYVTVYVPEYMNIHTNATTNVTTNATTNVTTNVTTNATTKFCDDKLHEIYDYYLNSQEQLEQLEVVEKNIGKNENEITNNNSKNLDYITNNLDYSDTYSYMYSNTYSDTYSDIT